VEFKDQILYSVALLLLVEGMAQEATRQGGMVDLAVEPEIVLQPAELERRGKGIMAARLEPAQIKDLAVVEVAQAQ
jgi:hypothetical protein